LNRYSSRIILKAEILQDSKKERDRYAEKQNGCYALPVGIKHV